MYMHYLSSAQGFWRKMIPHNLVNSCCLLGVHVERIIEPYARCLSLFRHPLSYALNPEISNYTLATCKVNYIYLP
jgi:hypothetical protein